MKRIRLARRCTLALAAAIALGVCAGPVWAVTSARTISRVSVDSSGVQGNDFSDWPSISADGRYVAFDSDASSLVAGDTNGKTDIFVHDRITGATTRVSVSSSGVQGNDFSGSSSISSDGRYVAFCSDATNLVAGDTNGAMDVFVHDRVTGATTRVSVDSFGSQADGGNGSPSISSDGRYVAFYSDATNLVAGDTNGTLDVFVHDRITGATTLVSVDSSGSQADLGSQDPVISSDGRVVAFFSYATNLVAGDTNGNYDVFAHDRVTGATTRVSVGSSGAQGNDRSDYPSISSDGRYVAFSSYASNLVVGDTNEMLDVFVHDRVTGATTRVSVSSSGAQGNEYSGYYGRSISFDGRYVAFSSYASNLVVGDTNEMWDIFVHDRVTGATTRVGVSSAGEQGNYDSCNPSISSDGQCVAFGSDASNLVAGDTNGTTDVFVDDRGVVAGSDSTAPHTDSDRVAYYANTATILLTASDNEGGSGVAHTYYILGGASQVESSTVRVTSTGAYTLSFWSVDASGNIEAPHTVTFTIIKPPPSSGTPSTPASIATLRHGRSFTVSGYVVKHTAGTSPVTLQFYRYQSGHWVLKKTTTAKVSTILTFSKYSDSTSVPYAGKWRVRARHKVGSHYHYSGYRTFSAS